MKISFYSVKTREMLKFELVAKCEHKNIKAQNLFGIELLVPGSRLERHPPFRRIWIPRPPLKLKSPKSMKIMGLVSGSRLELPTFGL
jgi:hypothetical protein